MAEVLFKKVDYTLKKLVEDISMEKSGYLTFSVPLFGR